MRTCTRLVPVGLPASAAMPPMAYAKTKKSATDGGRGWSNAYALVDCAIPCCADSWACDQAGAEGSAVGLSTGR